MVIYDLMCSLEHRFEGWFRSESDYLGQKKAGLLSCPLCEYSDVRKLPSASYISTGRSRNESAAEDEKRMDVKANDAFVTPTINPVVLEKIREYVESHSEDVGRQFAEEAKKMHYGEAEQRNIRGEVTPDEMLDLHEEGIEATPLPFFNTSNKKLN